MYLDIIQIKIFTLTLNFSWILENLNHRKNIQNIRSLALSSQIIGKVGSHYFLQDKFLIESTSAL